MNDKITSYVKQRGKDSFVGTYERWGKTWIYFQDKQNGRFKGVVLKDKDSEEAVKRYSGVKVKIKVKFPEQRGRQTITYNVYNRKQQKNLIYRMNERNRTPVNRKKFKYFVELLKTYKKDAVPIVKNKNEVDLLFDKYKYEDVKVEKYEGVSP